jgi:hypothetical protein
MNKDRKRYLYVLELPFPEHLEKMVTLCSVCKYYKIVREISPCLAGYRCVAFNGPFKELLRTGCELFVPTVDFDSFADSFAIYANGGVPEKIDI